MAISKEQPLRPYVQELGSAFDVAEESIDTVIGSVQQVQQQLQTIDTELENTQQDIIEINDKLLIIGNLTFGVSNEITAVGNTITTETVTYQTAFEAGTDTYVLYNTVTPDAGINIVMTGHDENGFTVNIVNANVEDVNVVIGYLVVKVV